jgi:tRNA-dihydrouridine synthase
VVPGKLFAIAPMMDWTDRHCRMFHRQLSRRALLYTEMVTALAIRHGDRQRLLGFDGREQPVTFLWKALTAVYFLPSARRISSAAPKKMFQGQKWKSC